MHPLRGREQISHASVRTLLFGSIVSDVFANGSQSVNGLIELDDVRYWSERDECEAVFVLLSSFHVWYVLYIRGLAKDEQSARNHYRAGSKRDSAKMARGNDALARLHEDLQMSFILIIF